MTKLRIDLRNGLIEVDGERARLVRRRGGTPATEGD